MHSLHRYGEVIKVSEFKNVIGRAGRAYVDVEGMVLFPMFDEIPKKRQNWEALITDLGAREMESGLVLLVGTLLARMRARIGGDLNQLIEYVVNNAAAWTFPEVANESHANRARALTDWERNIATLDTAILSLIGENDIPDEGIEGALDAILQSSLWHRRMLRQDGQVQQVLKTGLVARSRLIWSQSTAAGRRGYFLAGIGLKTGQALDAIAVDANLLLVHANAAISADDTVAAIGALTALAERVFSFYPFTPDPFPENWKDILRVWLLGQPIAGIAVGQESETLQFIEGGLVYRLPWAMEAIRVRAVANGDMVGADAIPLEDHELGLAVPAIETGTLTPSATILIQAGFPSRLAAIRAVTDTAATFHTGHALRDWLGSDVVAGWSQQPDWPTAETKAMWMDFVQNFTPRDNIVWADRRYWANVTWIGAPPPSGTPVQVYQYDGQPRVLSADGTPLGTVQAALSPRRAGLLRAQVAQDVGRIDITYLGPVDLPGV
jgi:hypothetical protein